MIATAMTARVTASPILPILRSPNQSSMYQLRRVTSTVAPMEPV